MIGFVTASRPRKRVQIHGTCLSGFATGKSIGLDGHIVFICMYTCSYGGVHTCVYETIAGKGGSDGLGFPTLLIISSPQRRKRSSLLSKVQELALVACVWGEIISGVWKTLPIQNSFRAVVDEITQLMHDHMYYWIALYTTTPTHWMALAKWCLAYTWRHKANTLAPTLVQHQRHT